MDDHDLRAMIRESIARQLGGGATAAGAAPGAPAFRRHPSHVLLPLATGGDEGDGLCLIEPTVRCNHCGYCVSWGH